jgi:hypothetical protein
MADGHDAASQRSRKLYQKPAITRVDLIEDEVALASCKKATLGNVASSGVTGTNKTCKSSCKAISPT